MLSQAPIVLPYGRVCTTKVPFLYFTKNHVKITLDFLTNLYIMINVRTFNSAIRHAYITIIFLKIFVATLTTSETQSTTTQRLIAQRYHIINALLIFYVHKCMHTICIFVTIL